MPRVLGIQTVAMTAILPLLLPFSETLSERLLDACCQDDFSCVQAPLMDCPACLQGHTLLKRCNEVGSGKSPAEG